MAWAILDPVAFITMLYFVFNMRFGDRQALGLPFIVYLMTGYVAFNFFSKAFNEATSSIQDSDFLLKKINFRVAIIPMIKLFANLYLHFIILILVIPLLLIKGIYPSFYWFQVLYYMFAMSFFLLGISWFASSISLFIPDLKNVIAILMRLLFFLTPIFWSMDRLPDNISRILKFNPLYYLVMGYRESFVLNVPFWKHPNLTLYFWGVTAFVLLLGIFVFRRLRPHFAEVI